MITADCVILDNNEVSSNESGLTGEPKDMKKSKNGDCFLLSSCLLTEGEGCKAVVIGIGERRLLSFIKFYLVQKLMKLTFIFILGMSSQWGKIKANLVTINVNTPLQEKLERMTTLVSLIYVLNSSFSKTPFGPFD